MHGGEVVGGLAQRGLEGLWPVEAVHVADYDEDAEGREQELFAVEH